MLKATALKCQSCGAKLEVAGHEQVVRCEYCGTNNLIHKIAEPDAPGTGADAPGTANSAAAARHRVHRPPPSPMVVDVQLTASTTKQARNVGITIAVVVGVTALAGAVVPIIIAVGAFKGATKQAERASGSATTSESSPSGSHPGTTPGSSEDDPAAGQPDPAVTAGPRRVGFRSSMPLLRDLNGDGVADLVGRIQVTGGGSDDVFVGALSGADLSELWRTGRLGTTAGTDRRLVVLVAGDAVLLAEGGRLTALNAADGKKRWSAALSAPVKNITHGEGKLRVASGDGQNVFIDPKTGSRAPLMGGRTGGSDDGPDFAVLRHDRREACFHYSVDDRKKALQAKRLDPKAAYCPDQDWSETCTAKDRLFKHGIWPRHRCSRDLGLVYAIKQAGPKNPVLLGYIKKLNQVVFQSPFELPGARGGFTHPPRIAFNKDRAVMLYTLSAGRKHTPHLRLFAWQTGQDLWDHPADFGGHVMPHYMFVVLTERRIFVVDRKQRIVYGFETASAKPAGRFGGPT